MPAAPDPSILLAHGVGIRKRAEGLAVRAAHPVIREQIELVAVAARDAITWLHDPEQRGKPGHLESIAETLRVQAAQLDQLEDALRDQGPAAGVVPVTRAH